MHAFHSDLYLIVSKGRIVMSTEDRYKALSVSNGLTARKIEHEIIER